MEKILIIRFSSIGDIVFTTAVVEALKARGDCEIDFLTLAPYTLILQSNPYLNRIISVPKDVGLRRLINLGQLLDNEGYSQAIDLHGSLRSKLVCQVMKKTHVKSYRKPRLKRFLLFYLKINLFGNEFELIDEFLRLISVKGNYTPRLYIDPLEKDKCLKWLEKWGLRKPYIVVVPGASWPNKIWKAKAYREFISGWNGQIVILGTEKDIICSSITDGFSNCINLQNKSDLRTSLIILSLAQGAIGSDTGLIHAAESMGTPVVMISGPTSRETGANVRLSNSSQIYSNVWCRPCSKNGARKCIRSERFCMTGITPSEVTNSVKRMLMSE